ncbi:MAG: hypothetical protein WC538_17955 [Thermoanaerobaculia bacterium]|jgi:hypothetical protein
MIEHLPIVFVCATRKSLTLDWSAAEPDFEVLYTTLPDLVLASVRRTNGPGSQDINAVIFDRSMNARTFLDFLSETSCEFRGDVLMINNDGSGVLSTVSNRAGRFIYQLDREDVLFYASARFGMQTHVAQPATPAYQLARIA